MSAVQSVERTFNILQILSGEAGGMTIKEIADESALHKSTVHRLLNTLVSLGYVSQDITSGRYRLNLKILNLGNRILEDFDIITIARPYLVRLSEELGQTVHLVTRDADEIVYIDKIDVSRRTFKMASFVGNRLPLYSTAVGKTILSGMDRNEFEGYWSSGRIKRITSDTITDRDRMIAELEDVRSRGYAMDREENETGIVCFAAKIPAAVKGEEYAISASVPSFNITPELEEKVPRLVMGTANEIASHIAG